MRLKFAVLVSLLATAFLAIPASSHDVLLDIEPAAGETITESQFEATLVFNNPLLVIAGESNAELATRLEGETEWVSHEITIDGAVLKAKVSLSQPGNYDLRWKVVSSDGHPISGDSNFVLDIVAPSEADEPIEPVLIDSGPNESSAGGSLTGFYIGLAMVILGAIFAPIGIMIRRRARK